jgi:hypothetical protein
MITGIPTEAIEMMKWTVISLITFFILCVGVLAWNSTRR